MVDNGRLSSDYRYVFEEDDPMGSGKNNKRQKAVRAITKRLPNVQITRGAAVTTVVTGAVVGIVGYVLGRRAL